CLARCLAIALLRAELAEREERPDEGNEPAPARRRNEARFSFVEFSGGEVERAHVGVEDALGRIRVSRIVLAERREDLERFARARGCRIRVRVRAEPYGV